jgi:hypothetical protein
LILEDLSGTTESRALIRSGMIMADKRTGPLSSGFALLWRRQGVLWWIFVVNFFCGLMGTLPGLLRLRHALGHSLMGQPLTDRFDLGMLAELFRLPGVSLIRFTTTSYLFAFVFFVFVLFVTGGVLETYRQDRRLAAGEFFAASGAFFWRFVRLLLLSIIPFVIVSMIYQALGKFADQAGDRAIADQVGVFLGWGAMAVFLLLALWVRLWFDIAQVRAVAQNERRMWRNTWRAWRISWHDLRSLYGMYFLIALLAWILSAAGLVIWTMLPPTATGSVFVIFELIMFTQIAARLWQQASAMSWYQRHEEMLPTAIVEPASLIPAVTAPAEVNPVPAVEAGTPPGEPASPPPQIAQVEPLPEREPPRDPGPELPPADA